MRLSLEQGTSLWALSDHRARKFRKQEQERREAALRAQEQACAHGALFKPGLSEGACVEPQGSTGDGTWQTRLQDRLGALWNSWVFETKR